MGKHVLWFLSGFAIGAGVSVPLVPRSGKDAHGLIAAKANHGRAFLVRSGARARSSAAQLLDRSRMSVERAKRALTAAVEAGATALSAGG